MGNPSETSVATAISTFRERPSLRDWIERLLPYASVVALFTALSILSPYFLTLQNLSSVCRQTAVITIIALGMTIIMISGGIDLSVGSVMAFAGICGTQLLESRHSLAASVAGAMLAGAAWGLLNSALITLLKVSPFIATLGTMGAARGLTLVMTNGMPVVNLPASFGWLGDGNLARVVPEGLRPVVDWEAWPRPAVFEWLAQHVGEEELRRVFNLGIGYCAVVPEPVGLVIGRIERA